MDKSSSFNWNFFQPGNWIFWVILSLLLKSGLFLFKINEHSEFPNVKYLETFAREAGDSQSYIDPVENLVTNGVYHSQLTFKYIGTIVSYGDFRMPGYGAIYFLLRQFFDTTNALNALVLLQLLTAAISVYVLALIVLELFASNKYFYVTFFLYVTSCFVSLYDHVIATESFCVSGLIFSLYFLIRKDQKNYMLLLSGLFLTWCIFLRPVIAPVLILFALFILFRNQWPKLKILPLAGKQMIIFLIPFLIVDGSWIYRNYKQHNGIYPLTTSVLYPGIEGSILNSVYNFLHAYGGSIVGWKSTSEINIFVPASNFTDIHFPGHIFNNQFNLDSLNLVKQLVIQVEDPSTPANVRNDLIETAKEKLNRYTQSIRDENPFSYYISSRFVYLKAFLMHSGSGNLFEKPSSELSVPALILKLYSSGIYVFVIIFGFLGCMDFLFIQRHHVKFVLIGLLGTYLALIHPLILKLDEWRYFTPSYPIFLIAGVYMGMKIYHMIVNRKTEHV